MSEIYKIFIENEQAIKRFVSRFHSVAEDIEDITQETFLKGYAAELQDGSGGIREPKAFLFKIARNTALMKSRRDGRAKTDLAEDLMQVELIVDEQQPGQDEHLNSRRKLVLFAKAVAALPPQCQRAFLLRRVEGLRYRQIANRMNISISAVEKHVATALVKCMSFMREQGYHPTELGMLHMSKAKEKPERDEDHKVVKYDDRDRR